MTTDPRGSQWRKWDLHVHTPASANTGFGDPFDDATWTRYANAVFEAASQHGIAAICLSDYFTLDGYRELVARGIYDPVANRWRSEGGDCALAVLPGVELRLSNITPQENAVNMHVIFDSKRLSVDRLTNDFLANLPLEPHHGRQALRATRSHMLALGKASQSGQAPNLSEALTSLPAAEQQSLWNSALGAASVSLNDLRRTLEELDKTIPGGRAYLLAFADSGHGGLHEYPWEGYAASMRQELLREADLLFSSNSGDRDFLLGMKASTPPRECIARFGRLKPCVWGSDSKSYDTLLHPSNGNSDRYTWIKADTTFEGLKQLVYEPGDRVAIQELLPDERPWNTIIDSVRFLDDAKVGFAGEAWIPLSEGLTAVIGGKSSGKSLLLHLIAKTIDPTQVKERVGPGSAPYDQFEQDISFEVRWKNGDVQTLGGAQIAPSRITYLPQSYINQLAEPDSQDQLAAVILRLLREDAAFAEADTRLNRDVEQRRAIVVGQVQKVFEHRRQIAEASERIESLGKETAIEAEIDRLQKEQAEIRKASGLSSEEELALSQLQARASELDGQCQVRNIALDTSSECAAGLRELLLRTVTELRSINVALPQGGGDAQLTGVVRTIEVLIGRIESEFATALDALEQERASLQAANATAAEQIAAAEKQMEPFKAKLDGRVRAEAAANAEAKQRTLLGEIREETQRRDRLRARLEDAIVRTTQAYRAIYVAHAEFVQEWLAGGSLDIARDVRLKASIGFDGASFWSTFQGGVDGRQRLADFRGYRDTKDDYRFPGLDEHCGDIERVLRDLAAPEADRKLRIRRAYTPDAIATALLRDHFALELSLEHEGDDLQRMSPGKRGMVLLRLLLEKSDATHPILIDQPEDNLDNRTVFTQLRQAIRARKRLRQIIVVSHNANLVVSTDSECVLVAHQYGPGERSGDLARFEYMGGALENSRVMEHVPGALARQGIREHVCEVLEGGEQAFRDRQQKYEFTVE